MQNLSPNAERLWPVSTARPEYLSSHLLWQGRDARTEYQVTQPQPKPNSWSLIYRCINDWGISPVTVDELLSEFPGRSWASENVTESRGHSA